MNGDAIDGTGRRQAGIGQWTTDLNQQVDAAAQLLEGIGAKRWFFTAGSPYHVETPGMRAEHSLADKFGTELEMDVSLRFGQHYMHFAHWVATSKVFHYRTTPIARELLIALCNQKSLWDYEWTVRSHCHYTVMVQYKSHAAIITPAWQMRTPFTIQRMSPFNQPDIGAVRLDLYAY